MGEASFDLSQADVITFDCYGTLIDWDTGIRNAFERAMRKTGTPTNLAGKALAVYEEEERRIEKEKPHLQYRQVLSKTALAVAGRIGWSLKETESSFLAESLPTWTPFPDTNPALERLGRRHTLGILSNVDNDLLAGTMKRVDTKFDVLVTAENVRSYKPAFAHFEQAHQMIGEKRWVHVAQSQYHDIEPALTLGIKAIWVNRKKVRPLHDYSDDQVLEVRDLKDVADHLA